MRMARLIVSGLPVVHPQSATSRKPRRNSISCAATTLARLTPLIAVVILTEFMDFVMLFKVALVAIFPNVATPGIEERVVTPAIRELDTAVASVRHGGLGLKDWFQYDHCKKQSGSLVSGSVLRSNVTVQDGISGSVGTIQCPPGC